MRHFRQSRHWRQTFVAICLPYLLASVLVDFVHVHRQPAGALSAAPGETALAAVSTSAKQPDSTCSLCVWLRTGHQVTPNASDRLGAGVATTALVLPPDAVWPDSPVGRSALLRGPPSVPLS